MKKNQDNKVQTVLVCRGTGCVSAGADAIQLELEKEAKGVGIEVKFTGCHGFCQRGPLVVIEPDGIFYSQVKPEDTKDILESLMQGKYVERLFYKDPATHKPIPYYKDIPFYKKQQRMILKNCGRINPEDINEYIATGGYEALKKVLFKMKPQEVIDEVKRSGLRGRGGAGFPTGDKWEVCRMAPSVNGKYVICNGDEGDPGAFQDRSILEADPHSVLEGMIIAGYAIGANEGFIYVRAEYPLAVRRFKIALRQAEENGFLGDNILGSGFSFSIKVVEGAGAFVCGEETGLMAAVEGRRGMPRARPPYPAVSGLWGKPTLINNIKSLASIPLIIKEGGEWFASIGTEGSKGTAVFALTGKVENCGLIEVPMGITLRKIIYEIGGGTPKEFKAVQTGGPSGGCLPKELLDLPIDFDSLTEAGSMMGSGGMIVMDEDTCMVDVAHYFLDFTQKESCGKCTPCRIGTKYMVEILEKIREGMGTEDDLNALERLAKTVKLSSLCGLGQTAPNPVLTTLRYFRDEYEAHIKEKRCPALVCKKLISFYIIPEKCVGCLLCLKNCPVGAISGELKKVHIIDQSKCTKCGVCLDICPKKIDAVVKYSGNFAV